ncbi:MAG: oligopeptide/dipeptide ABC transporter ATP-binding protein [Sterolibacterium sp.]
MALLEIENLSVTFGSASRPLKALDGLNLCMEQGEVVGIVGESGSGKSTAGLALMGLIDYPGRVTARRMNFDGRDLLRMQESERQALRGKDIAMIFQDPLTSLNPCFSIAYQLEETLRVHQAGTRGELRERALALLRLVEIPDPEQRMDAYPHQLSGGMCQRVMLAMAIACNPRLLIADEPTTALDVTVQAQMLELLTGLQKQRGMALLLITHDLGVVAQVAHRVIVMYAGQVMEQGLVPDIFDAPRHPYTQALLASLPENNVGKKRLATIPGNVPSQYERPDGCVLHPRCDYAQEVCQTVCPALAEFPDSLVRCHFPLDKTSGPCKQNLTV